MFHRIPLPLKSTMINIIVKSMKKTIAAGTGGKNNRETQTSRYQNLRL